MSNYLESIESIKSIKTPPSDSDFQFIIDNKLVTTPLLLKELEEFANSPSEPSKSNSEYIGHITSIYLLSYLKEEKALNSIIKIASHPDDTFIKSTGEVFTESLGRIFASICNGNLKQIKTVIENQHANPWMRAGALDCLMVLWEEEVISRLEIVDYLKTMIPRMERKSGYTWDSIALLAYDIHPKELEKELIDAINDRLIEPIVLNKKALKNRLQDKVSNTLAKKVSHEASGYIKHPTEELTWWLYPDSKTLDKGMEFANVVVPMVDKKMEPGERQAPLGWRNDSTVISNIKTGRNSLCPCGSQKKYKKCCGLHI